MPSGYIHDQIAIRAGYPPDLVRKVNRFIDQPAAELGPTHRRVRHDVQTAMELAKMFNDPRATFIAMLHYQVDASANTPADRQQYQMLEVTMRMQDGTLGAMNYNKARKVEPTRRV